MVQDVKHRRSCLRKTRLDLLNAPAWFSGRACLAQSFPILLSRLRQIAFYVRKPFLWLNFLIVHSVEPMRMRDSPLWVLLVAATVAAQQAQNEGMCSLQLQRSFGNFGSLEPMAKGLLVEQPAAHGRHERARIMQGLWSTPGRHFQQCPSARQTEFLQVDTLAPLPDKVQCREGVPIGNFNGDEYHFSCCSGGDCGGCRLVNGNNQCQQCAAGYVRQVVPVINKTRCFMCDDIPEWHDMHGRSCSDYAKLHLCKGPLTNISASLALSSEFSNVSSWFRSFSLSSFFCPFVFLWLSLSLSLCFSFCLSMSLSFSLSFSLPNMSVARSSLPPSLPPLAHPLFQFPSLSLLPHMPAL